MATKTCCNTWGLIYRGYVMLLTFHFHRNISKSSTTQRLSPQHVLIKIDKIQFSYKNVSIMDIVRWKFGLIFKYILKNIYVCFQIIKKKSLKFRLNCLWSLFFTSCLWSYLRNHIRISEARNTIYILRFWFTWPSTNLQTRWLEERDQTKTLYVVNTITFERGSSKYYSVEATFDTIWMSKNYIQIRTVNKTNCKSLSSPQKVFYLYKKYTNP